MKSQTNTELIVIGGSAGSLQVIIEMIKNLGNTIPAPIVLVMHRKAQSGDILRTLLQQFTEIPVIEVEDKTAVDGNTIYIVPADYHLLFENTQWMSLDSSEKMNYSRPSIDVTFRSAAEIYGDNLIGILLSGANADGVEGLSYIKRNNGQVWIQDPGTAEVEFMPKHAIEEIEYDLIITPADLAGYIKQLQYLRIDNLHNMSKKKILIFDDEAAILEVITIIFEENGYDVKISETSHDILEKVADYQPDVILMDNWIPKIGGVEATKLLKSTEEFKHIPVIYVTANNDIVALASEARADDYVSKPFNLDDLEAMVAKHLKEQV